MTNYHDFDSILSQVGDFGPYQWVMYVLLCLPASLPSAFTAFNQVFVAAVPSHWCAFPDNATHLAQRNDTYLLDHDVDTDTSVRSSCEMYNLTSVINGKDTLMSNQGWRNTKIPCQYGWSYDRSTYKETIATHFNLVCDEGHWPSTSTTGFYVGSFMGNILFGYVADRWGRRVSFFSILTVQVIFGTLNAFAPNIIVFCVLRFFVGLTFPALYQIPFIVGMEMMGPGARIFSGMVVCIFFGLAMSILGIVAWVLHGQWVWITIASNTPFVVLFSYYFFLPESARWMVTVGRVDEAAKGLEKIGKWNKQPVAIETLQDECRRLYESSTKDAHHSTERPNLIDLFRTPNLRKKTLIITWTWLVNAVVYNGLTLNVSNLPVNDYLSFTINGLAELPAYFIIWPLLDRVGRRWPLVTLMLFGGGACLATLLFPFSNAWAISGLAFAGKFGVAGAFSVIYVFAGELYPTVIRALGMGMSSMVAGSGLILAPYLVQLSSLFEHLPLIVMGCLMVSAGIGSMFLPETLGAHLPQTIMDAEHFGIGVPFCYCPTRRRSDSMTMTPADPAPTLDDALDPHETVELIDQDVKQDENIEN